MAISTPKRVCWDACAWVALIQKEKVRDRNGVVTEDRYGHCRVVVDLAEKGSIEIVTSGLSLAEVCKNPSGGSGSGDQIGPYFENAWVLVVPVDTFVGTVARTLMMAGHTGLKPPDAIHLATAIVANADGFHTFDQRLLDLDGRLSTQDGNILKICKPMVSAAPAPLLDIESLRAVEYLGNNTVPPIEKGKEMSADNLVAITGIGESGIDSED